MKDVLDLWFKLGIYCLIMVFEECGFICCFVYCVCVIEIVKFLDDMVFVGFMFQVIDGGKFEVKVLEMFKGFVVMELFIMGKIVVGVLIEVISYVYDYVVVSGLMFFFNGKYFVFEVKGDLMIDVGINDGDVVIIKDLVVVQDGDIVVVLIEEEEVMLKIYKC